MIVLGRKQIVISKRTGRRYVVCKRGRIESQNDRVIAIPEDMYQDYLDNSYYDSIYGQRIEGVAPWSIPYRDLDVTDEIYSNSSPEKSQKHWSTKRQ